MTQVTFKKPEETSQKTYKVGDWFELRGAIYTIVRTCGGDCYMVQVLSGEPQQPFPVQVSSTYAIKYSEVSAMFRGFDNFKHLENVEIVVK